MFVAVLLALDAQGLRTLMARSADGWLAAGILTFAMGLTFGSVQMGVAVMMLAARDDGGRGRRRPARRHPTAPQFGGRLAPAPVSARPPRG